MKYFDHDTEAHKDDKIMLLRREFGGAAVDAYWTLLEVIYREETQLKPRENPFGFLSVSMFLLVDEKQLLEWVEGMAKYGLLEVSKDADGNIAAISPAVNTETDAGISSFASPIREAYTVTGGRVSTSLVSPTGSAQSAQPIPAAAAAISPVFIYFSFPLMRG